MKREIVVKEFLTLTNLIKALILYIYELMQFFISHINKTLIFTVFQVILPYFKSISNSEKLTIMSFILSFALHYQNCFYTIDRNHSYLCISSYNISLKTKF